MWRRVIEWISITLPYSIPRLRWECIARMMTSSLFTDHGHLQLLLILPLTMHVHVTRPGPVIMLCIFHATSSHHFSLLHPLAINRVTPNEKIVVHVWETAVGLWAQKWLYKRSNVNWIKQHQTEAVYKVIQEATSMYEGWNGLGTVCKEHCSSEIVGDDGAEIHVCYQSAK